MGRNRAKKRSVIARRQKKQTRLANPYKKSEKEQRRQTNCNSSRQQPSTAGDAKNPCDDANPHPTSAFANDERKEGLSSSPSSSAIPLETPPSNAVAPSPSPPIPANVFPATGVTAGTGSSVATTGGVGADAADGSILASQGLLFSSGEAPPINQEVKEGEATGDEGTESRRAVLQRQAGEMKRVKQTIRELKKRRKKTRKACREKKKQLSRRIRELMVNLRNKQQKELAEKNIIIGGAIEMQKEDLSELPKSAAKEDMEAAEETVKSETRDDQSREWEAMQEVEMGEEGESKRQKSRRQRKQWQRNLRIGRRPCNESASSSSAAPPLPPVEVTME